MKEWAEELKRKGIKKVYIIYGEDEYIRQKAVRMLIEAVSLNIPDFNHTLLDGRVKAEEIITACETMPMMDEKRLVHIKNYEPLSGKSEETKILEEYIPKLPDTAVLLFDTSDKADKRRKLYKTVEKLGVVKEFNKPSITEIIETVMAEARIRGINFTRETANALVLQSGDDLKTLVKELDKLSVLKENGTVTKTDIREVASKSLEYDVFLLHGLFMEGKTAQALALFNQVLEEEKNAFGVIGIIASKFRLLLKARAMMDAKYAVKDILSNMGAHPRAANEAMQNAKYFTADAIRVALKALSDLDYRLKSGQGGKYLAESVLLSLYKK